MMARDVDDRGVSMLVEYLILMGILSVFVVVMSLQLHETLSNVQIVRVMENNFADVASQISAIYTDYVLILPSNGKISTNIRMPSSIGGKIGYTAKFEEISDIAFLKVEGEKVSAFSGLGFTKFISNSGEVMKVNVSGETLSFKSENENEKPKVEYEKVLECPFIPKPRLEFIPGSVALNDQAIAKIVFYNPGEINSAVNWSLILWNGTKISGNVRTGGDILLNLRVSDVSGCSRESAHDYKCYATVLAEVVGRDDCNGTHSNWLLVSDNPQRSNPYIVYEKWVEPRIVAPGGEFRVHLRIEGRGFFVEGATNLSVVHIVDVSGSMIWPTIFKNYSFTVTPNVVKETVNLTSSGRLEVWAYTSDKLQGWYSNSACKACSNSTSKCPWYNVGYDESFIKLYINGLESGNDYSDGGKLGKFYRNNNANAGNYTIEVVAKAPEQINLTIVVKFKGSEVLNKTVPYLNREVLSFELPPAVNYTFLAIADVGSLPSWSNAGWGSWTRIESYSAGGSQRYWDYRNRTCGHDSFSDGNLNVWLAKPDGDKEFLMKANPSPPTWYQARNNYGINGINAEVFIPNPQTGTYTFVIVPTTKNPVTFTATALIKRIDAAKLAAITFNSMLGQRDLVGLATFTTDAERIEVNVSPLKYMTNDRNAANSRILGLRALLATDHPDGLYYGARVFPVWNEIGNNCSGCISERRPLIVMLTDGEPTICNRGANYFGCSLCTQNCSGDSWCEAAKNQALCVANYLKNYRINDYNVSICTIGFSTDIGSQGQQFLRQMASLRPDNNEPCYFFAETSEELVEAYKTIFNAFQIAAKQIYVTETLNASGISLSSPFKVLDATVKSSKGSPIPPPEVIETHTNTVVRVNITSIQKDEVIEIVLRLKVKDTAPLGEYDINDDNNSFIEYTALDYRGNEVERIRVPITSTKDKVTIVSGRDAQIILG
ncbi:MAG: vWA domain-containing protein [Archaeoglobaceae archaeon]